MTGPRSWRRAFRFPFRSADMDREVEDELDFHIEELVRRLVGEGWPREEAGREAARRFGDRHRHEDTTRRIARRRYRLGRLAGRIAGALSEVRIAARSLRRRPAFTASTVLVLGLGIAACTTVFSFASAVLLRPLPYPEPDRLVRVEERREPGTPGLPRINLTLTDIERIRDRSTRLAGIAGFVGSTVPYADEGGARRIPASNVDPELFGVLGISPALGRTFTAEDATAGAERVAVIGHRLWIDRFGGDPGAIGRSIELAYEPHRIVGVMPPGFDFPDGAEVWRPLLPSVFTRRFHVVQTIARLAPGESNASAGQELEAIVSASAEAEPELHQTVTSASVRGWHAQLVADVRPAILVLAGAVAILLCLVSVNVAGLLSARALEREREVALRRSLGATALRVAGGALWESLLLAAAGGVLGYVLSVATLGWVVGMSPDDLPARDLVRPDAGAAVFTAGLVLLVGLGAGVLPALRSSRVAAPLMLRGGGGTVGGGGSRRAGGLLISLEVGAATLLLVGGASLLNSFVRILSVDTGVDNDDVLAVSLSLPGTYEDEAAFDFFARVRREAAALPGVTGTAISLFAPLRGSIPVSGVEAVGRPRSEGDDPVTILSVSPEYFELVGTDVRGRTFDATDDRDGARVALPSRAAARALWGEEDPIGRRLSVGGDAASAVGETDVEYRVVGVAEDVRQEGPMNPPPAVVYLPFEQYIGWGGGTLLLSAEEDPAGLVPQVRNLLRRLDPRLPIDRVETVAQGVAGSIAEPRFFTVLVVAFAGLATLVAVAGLYGILAYDVRRRFVELGIRAVLGARPRDNVGLLLRRGSFYLAIGVAAGVLAALPLVRLLEGLLYGIEPTDPSTFAAAAIAMLGIGLVAALVPALHATRAHPATAIRSE